MSTTFNDRADQEEPEERSSTDNLLKKRSSAVLGLYPHDLHPGLVPGISVEEQRNTFGIDKIVFSVTAIFIVAFIAWGISSPESVASVSSTAYAWAMNNVAWLLNLVMGLGLFVMLYLAFSRFGNIPLGKDDEKPEFSRFSWIAMMFGAGIGVGIFFFGPPSLWRTSYHRRLTQRNQQLQKLCTRLWLSHTFTGVLQFGDCMPSLAEHLHIPHFGAAARR